MRYKTSIKVAQTQEGSELRFSGGPESRLNPTPTRNPKNSNELKTQLLLHRQALKNTVNVTNMVVKCDGINNDIYVSQAK